MADFTDPVDTSTEQVRDTPVNPQPSAKRTGPTPKAKRGTLLDMPEEKAFKKAEQEWDKSPWLHRCQAGESMQNSMWRRSIRYVRVEKDQDRGIFRLITPISSESLPAGPNKVEELVQNAIAIVNTDPFRFDAEPASDSPRSRDAAQFATRFLDTLSPESGLNLDGVISSAMDIAATYASGFAHVCYDPTAAGLTPLTIKARPSAKSPQTALTGEMPDGTVDSGPFVAKFVTNAGTLSDTPADAKLVWQGGIKLDLFNSNQVKFLPRQCLGISDAKGVIIANFQTLGDLKRYPTVAKMSPDDLWSLVGWKTKDYKRLLPDGYQYRPPDRRDNDDPDSPPEDDALVCTLTVYYKSHPAYPFGCYATFGGGKFRLNADELMAEAPDNQGRPQKEALDIPIAQMRWRSTPHTGNPYGQSTVQIIGPIDDARAEIFASGREYLYKFTKARLMLPQGTTIQPEDMDNPETAIYFNPEGKPEWQPIPDYPQFAMLMLDRLDKEMDNAMGVQGPAIGQVAGSVRSAEQQNTLIEQSNVALSSLRDNTQDFAERLGRLILQKARVSFTTPQLMQYRGDDGAFQAEEFTSAQFLNTQQVRIRRGSGTMQSPTAKSDMISKELQSQWMTLPEAQRLKRDSIGPSLGLQDSPHTLNVRRQLVEWRKGPDEGTLQQEGMFQQEQAMMAQMAPPITSTPQPQTPALGTPSAPSMPGESAPPMAGAPNAGTPDSPPPAPQGAASPPQTVMPPGSATTPAAPLPPPSPLMVAAGKIFALTPVDEEQDVAILRHQELSRAIPEMSRFAFPPEWNGALVQAYLQARMAAGVQTIAEQQAAMAAQQQAEAQGQADQVKAKSQADGESHSQKMQQNQDRHNQKMDHNAQSQAMKAA